MKKYNKYDNELTRYINLLLGYDISDIIGDIVGDIIDADIPINVPKGDTSFDVATPLGTMHIKYTNNYIQDLIQIYHKIGEKFYGEYTIDSMHLFSENKITGLTLEKRGEGIVLTEIARKYTPCEEGKDALRLSETGEKRYVFTNQQLYDIGLYLWCFPIETSFQFVKEDYKKFKQLTPKVEAKTSIHFPEYKKIGPEGSGFYGRFHFFINSDPFSHLYENIEADRKLEIVNDLFHGRITSLNIEHLKNMVMWSLNRDDYRNHMIAGFDIFSRYKFFRSTDDEKIGTINSLTTEYIGPSLITIGKEYYEYLRNLALSTLQIDFSPSEIEKDGLVQLMKSYYSENTKK